MTAWQLNQLALQKHIETEPLDNFLQWSTVRKTMYVGNGAAHIQGEYEALKAEWDKWEPVVEKTEFGGDSFEGNYSPNLIHQAYHLKQWLDRTKQKLGEMSTIIEVGAGYGAMTLVAHRLGFKGRYYIIDLPELAQLQQYYLSRVLPGDWSNVFWLNTPPLSKISCDLLVASHSLGEMPMEDREKLLAQIEAEEYLFASSYEFEGIDNAAWFQQFAGGTIGFDWVFYPHRWQENAFYMVGINER